MKKKFEIYREERSKGLTYREIAAKYGVSRQVVAQACGRYQPARFQYVTETGCVYVNLRNWMNANKVNKSELLRRMGLETLPVNIARWSSYLSGRVDPPKKCIDMLIAATGLSYEELFYMEEGLGAQ